jgi:hypothetical protein
MNRTWNDRIDGGWARVDLTLNDAEVRDVGHRVFTVARPVSYVPGWVRATADFADEFSVTGIRHRGTDPVAHLADTDDPQALAQLVTAHHDYPDPEMMGHILD